ncbi:unnamed protein product [Porites lobata]|uniref:Transmembrane protein 198 n=1 Tax=Porites lobata TaxID=104759 RepID=A0ABN8N587_9CNID|nr:unnamed protein product [Porites lobata]
MAIVTIPSLAPYTDSCKLHNSYDAQSCVLAAVCILVGTVLCFFGYRVFKFTLFLAGFAAGFFFTYLLCSGYLVDHLPEKALEHKDQIFLGVSLGVGIIAGLMTLCVFYLGLFVLGATMGWFVGMLLLPLMYKHVEFLSEHNWVPYIVLLAFAIAGGILIICIQKVIIVISTSFVGAFAVITGFDYYLENSTALYYSVNMLHGHYDKSELPHCWYTWLMFSLIPIMFIAGMVVQLKKTGQGRDHREAYSRRSRVPFMGTRMDEFSDQRPLVTAEE